MVKLSRYTATELKKFNSQIVREKYPSIPHDVILIQEDTEILNYVFLLISKKDTPHEIATAICKFRDSGAGKLREVFENVKIEIPTFKFTSTNTEDVVLQVYNKDKHIISVNFRFDL